MHHRFFSSEPVRLDGNVRLEGREFHHAAKVRRLRAGEPVEVIDPGGSAFTAVVDSVDADALILRITGTAPTRESGLDLTLALALIKPDNFELVLQKGTELGVTRFIPVVSERVEVRTERVEKRHDRWTRIIEEAVKQCGRSRTPELTEPTSFDEVVRNPASKYVLDADAQETGFERAASPLVILIGPEGGFTADELCLAEKAGCRGLRVGPRRMRAETAAMAAVTLAQAKLGDLR